MEKPRWAEVRKIMALGMRALGRAVIGAAAARCRAPSQRREIPIDWYLLRIGGSPYALDAEKVRGVWRDW